MPKRKTIPSEPDKTTAKRKARELLTILGYDSFPIDPFKVLDDLPANYQVNCLSWTEMKDKMKIEDPFHLKQQEADARTILTSSGLYMVVYQDIVPYPDRIPFTIAHEIGHIFMNHLTDFGLNEIARGGLSEDKYQVLEDEADIFAGEFLMPTCLINRYCPEISADDIKVIFGVSNDAASARYGIMHQFTDYECEPYDTILKRQFFNFFKFHYDETYFSQYYRKVNAFNLPRRNPIHNKCSKCKTIVLEAADFCTHCGERITEGDSKDGEIPNYKTIKEIMIEQGERAAFFKTGGIQHRKLPTVNIKQRGINFERLSICPTCLNHKIESDDIYCSICGTILYNICRKCNRILPYNCSCCSYCGSKTSLYDTYELYEKRCSELKEESKRICQSEDLVEYPYWEYIKGSFENSFGGPGAELYSALFYSSTFTDDENNLLIFVIDPRAENVIRRQHAILQAMLQSQGLYVETIKVRCVGAL